MKLLVDLMKGYVTVARLFLGMRQGLSCTLDPNCNSRVAIVQKTSLLFNFPKRYITLEPSVLVPRPTSTFCSRGLRTGAF